MRIIFIFILVLTNYLTCLLTLHTPDEVLTKTKEYYAAVSPYLYEGFVMVVQFMSYIITELIDKFN